MTRSTVLSVLVVAAIVAGFLAVGAASSPSAAQDSDSSPDSQPEETSPLADTRATTVETEAESVRCPVMTDSIDRLFLALFNREATGTEFRNLTDQYRSGISDLETIANDLAASEEFQTRYGAVDDERYVEVVYRNVLRRAPSDEDKEFWQANLGSGYGRGQMMLAFSESEEFVRRTDTVAPLAGYLRWYPEGSHWYCGVGARPNLGIRPLEELTVYADFMFTNTGDEQSPVGITTLVDGTENVSISRGSLPPGFSDYKWGGQFNGDGNYGSALSIAAGNRTSWVVVFYPSPIGDQRPGWQLEL